METSIAIITARGGSKRIPRKNIRDFCGKPILAYSIEAALSSKVFDEVMVSTEDMEIAEIAKGYGAKVPFFRSAEASNDYAATADVLLEVLAEYQALGRNFQYGCCIYPTAPFVTAEKLKNAMEQLKEDGVSSVVPVTAFSFPPMRGFLLDNGQARYAFPEFAPKRSQDLPAMYHDCGQFYCFRANAFLKSKSLVMEHAKAMVMPEMEVQDIDNEQDWQLAELKYLLMRENAEKEPKRHLMVEKIEKEPKRHPMGGKIEKEPKRHLMAEKIEQSGKGHFMGVGMEHTKPEHRYFLRKAEWKDVDRLFQWANEREVRENSFSTAPIPYEGHKSWFREKLKDGNTQIYIFCDGSLEVGTLRLEFEQKGQKEGEVLISYSIVAEHRNKGYGQKLIALAEQEACKWAKSKQTAKNAYGKIIVKAQVKAENEASNRIFARAGYEAYEIGYQKIMRV